MMHIIIIQSKETKMCKPQLHKTLQDTCAGLQTNKQKKRHFPPHNIIPYPSQNEFDRKTRFWFKMHHVMWHLCGLLRTFQFDRCCKYLKYNEVKSEVEVGAGRAPQTLLDNFSRHNIFFHSLLKCHIKRNIFTLS